MMIISIIKVGGIMSCIHNEAVLERWAEEFMDQGYDEEQAYEMAQNKLENWDGPWMEDSQDD